MIYLKGIVWHARLVIGTTLWRCLGELSPAFIIPEIYVARDPLHEILIRYIPLYLE